MIAVVAVLAVESMVKQVVVVEAMMAVCGAGGCVGGVIGFDDGNGVGWFIGFADVIGFVDGGRVSGFGGGGCA
ncbi:hypothetical protein DPMN_182485 [Dreissena polymorpha]|uniref:Uncharacterized protein n=1 Tax=Dreissena polymorpha TaxID=45954 RepID=A0A9D4DFU7_DREPO|nr:hypothetical protein DPMN_182485 [Dreissena polymorpha]